MAGGLVGLFDDVAALARLAAASIDDVAVASGRATTKAAGVLIDDAAVTPQYVAGIAAERELPIIKRIAKGSIRNKFLFVLPVLLLLSEFADFLLTPLLMIGGGYLCYEAVHKIHGKLTGHDEHDGDDPTPKSEDQIVGGAIRTDLILSAEIMVIALNEVADDGFGFIARGVILAVVAVIITVIVYGSVAIIVKMDDIGLRMVDDGGARADLGRRLVAAMPKVLTFLTVVGTAAMLWVGGHIEIVGLDELGFTAPYDWLHDVEESIKDAIAAGGGFLAWLVDTAASAVFGFLVGIPLVAAQLAWSRTRGTPAHH